MFCNFLHSNTLWLINRCFVELTTTTTCCVVSLLFVSDYMVIDVTFCTVTLHNAATWPEFMSGFHQEGIPWGFPTNIPSKHYRNLQFTLYNIFPSLVVGTTHACGLVIP